MEYEIIEKMSLEESKRQTKERKEHGLNIVASVGNRTMKTDSGWNDTLSKIAEAHPQSALAKERTKKTVKQIKTEQALAKNKRRIKGLK